MGNNGWRGSGRWHIKNRQWQQSFRNGTTVNTLSKKWFVRWLCDFISQACDWVNLTLPLCWWLCSVGCGSRTCAVESPDDTMSVQTILPVAYVGPFHRLCVRGGVTELVRMAPFVTCPRSLGNPWVWVPRDVTIIILRQHCLFWILSVIMGVYTDSAGSEVGEGPSHCA